MGDVIGDVEHAASSGLFFLGQLAPDPPESAHHLVKRAGLGFRLDRGPSLGRERVLVAISIIVHMPTVVCISAIARIPRIVHDTIRRLIELKLVSMSWWRIHGVCWGRSFAGPRISLLWGIKLSASVCV
jgi:hypothetical protein